MYPENVAFYPENVMILETVFYVWTETTLYGRFQPLLAIFCRWVVGGIC